MKFPPSSEIKSRIKSGQIRLNGDPISIETYRSLKLESAIDLGEWVFQNAEHLPVFELAKRIGFDIEVLADTNMKSLKKIFDGKSILRLSKKELYVIDKNDILL